MELLKYCENKVLADLLKAWLYILLGDSLYGSLINVVVKIPLSFGYLSRYPV